jgi:hypothetical protein
MDLLEQVLKAAGWTNALINHFVKNDRIADIVSATQLVFDFQAENQPAIDCPPKIDSNTYYCATQKVIIDT